MRFLVDAQLPPSLAGWLRGKGFEAHHDICAYAEQGGFVIVTKDRDFLPVILPDPLQVLWVRTGNCSNSMLFQKIEASWPDIIRYLDAGARLVEFR